MNLLKETKSELKEHGKSLKDIKWIGCDEFTIPLENFVTCADSVYDDGYGSQMVATDLVVVGEDWWMERHEYDGSEWWEYKELPQRPSEEREAKRVIAERGLEMWSTLESMNRGGD